MFRNYLKTAFRNLLKHKADSSINLIGLVMAFTSSLLLFLSVWYEFNYDDFHANGNRIHKLYIRAMQRGKVELGTSMPMPLAPTMKADYPEIEAIAREQNSELLGEAQDKKISIDVVFTDADYLRIFSFPMLEGSSTQALAGLDGVVLRRSVAEAFFGKKDPVGQTLRIRLRDGVGPATWRPFTVTGVTGDIPANSSMKYDALVRFENALYYQRDQTAWNNWNHTVNLLLREGADPKAFLAKTTAFNAKHFPPDVAQLTKAGTQPFEDGSYQQFGLLPLSEFHTNANLGSGNTVEGGYLYLLLTIGILIVVIACINFVNLSIGRSFTRTREVGLRKTLGAMPWQLAMQFWAEVVLVSLTAFVLSGVATWYLLPVYKQLFALNLSTDLLFSPRILGMAFAIFLVVTLVAGAYPVWVIARLQIADVLRGRSSAVQPSRIRNTLIVAQFSIATLLIICTIIAWQQVNFLRTQPLGYNREQVVSIPIEGEMHPTRALELMRQELVGKPNVLAVSGIYNNLVKARMARSRTSIWGFGYKDKLIQSHWMGVSYEFAHTLGLQMVAGRDFNAAIPSDSNAALINETLAAQLGEKDPIGVLLPADSAHPKRIIGVFKDFNFRSLHHKMAPLTLVLSRDFPVYYILVKVAPTDLPGSMAMLKLAYAKVNPNGGFLGSFLDENIERQYQQEQRLGQMFICGAVVAILLSCMGLLAIVILVLAQRTREIGIRKVLGASVSGLVTYIFADFARLVLIGIVIASPPAWYAAHTWLAEYPFRVPIHWWVFALAGLLTLLIALLTVVSRAYRAATANPIKSLRTE